MFRRPLAALALVVALLLTTAVRAEERITVFAAASLKNALDEAIAVFGKATGAEVVASYAASSALAKQIEAGAPADLFFSADIPWMDYLAERELIDASSRLDLLGNDLVLVAPAASDLGALTVDGQLDLAGLLGEGRLATGQVDSVPAGRYAKAALLQLDLWNSVEQRLAQSDNVRTALALVAREEAPLGIVYATDAAAEAGVKIVGMFPETSHPPIVYPLALIRAGASKPGAMAFLAYLKSDAATPIFRKAGFKLLHPPAS
ncbi:MAG TPA: molybdate ABC transporter substrate-binding protein [Geminicoccus sp.]|jgi:molybdate transport system substrate-binding protein|uniref:molybdate ABC transporter substrate-binding protein n=1 Tax=Geminicoccus sp. TaxID=2024832 RepID=UPI002E335848|nr:molybdate ABC transporter substrate-binding protein [Geminicoccus sp.]HEX2529789.1 molybdate ABC transporter substrate-binding protein [Geminicoccus sp.]